MKLYGTPVSRALRSIWAAEEVGVDYELVSTSYLGKQDARIPRDQSQRPHSGARGWRSRTLRVDGHQSLSRQDLRRQALPERPARRSARDPVDDLGHDRTRAAPDSDGAAQGVVARGSAGSRCSFQRRDRGRKTARRARCASSRIGNTCSAAISRLPTSTSPGHSRPPTSRTSTSRSSRMWRAG